MAPNTMAGKRRDVALIDGEVSTPPPMIAAVVPMMFCPPTADEDASPRGGGPECKPCGLCVAETLAPTFQLQEKLSEAEG